MVCGHYCIVVTCAHFLWRRCSGDVCHPSELSFLSPLGHRSPLGLRDGQWTHWIVGTIETHVCPYREFATHLLLPVIVPPLTKFTGWPGLRGAEVVVLLVCRRLVSSPWLTGLESPSVGWGEVGWFKGPTLGLGVGTGR